jgi:ribosomal protein L11 methyltransferase
VPETFDRLVDLGAIDIEFSDDGGLAALLPDSLTAERLASALGIVRFQVSPAFGRDDASVWVLSPRPIRVGRLTIVPAHADATPDTVRLIDTPAFGTGLHPTTALCLQALDDLVEVAPPEAVLDVGTGSGVLALAALALGVRRALGIDVDDQALRAAADNRRLNGLDDRLELQRGGPGETAGRWPLVLANILAAPLIEMAPALVRRVGHRGQLVLSGVPASIEPDVTRAYQQLGMRRVDVRSRDGWVALTLQASW